MSNKEYFHQNITDIDTCADEIYRMLDNEQTILLLGAGVSISAGLPSAWEFCQEIISKICNSPVVIDFAENQNIQISDLKKSFSDIDFDTMFGLLKRSDSNNLKILSECFKEGHPSSLTYQILSLYKELNVKAIFTTNFDQIVEKAASKLDIDYQVFASNIDFPSDIMVSDSLPIFKIHGCAGSSHHPIDLGIDFTEIGKDKLSKRGNLLKTYLETHSVILLGYISNFIFKFIKKSCLD